MKEFRQQLDEIDEEVIRLFAVRYAVRREIARYKKAQDLPVVDPDRVKEVIVRAKAAAEKYDVPVDFAEALYKLVIDYSHKFEMEKEEVK